MIRLMHAKAERSIAHSVLSSFRAVPCWSEALVDERHSDEDMEVTPLIAVPNEVGYVVNE